MKKSLMVMIAIVMGAIVNCAEKPKLIFNTQDFAPFSYMENKKAAGPGVEIIELVCRDMDIDCQINLLPWTRAVKEAQDNVVNGLFFLGKNAERETWLDFSVPLINTEYGFFIAKDDPIEYKDVKDFKNYTIGVYGPSNTADSLNAAIKGIEGIKVDETVDDIAGFRKLGIKRVGAVYSNRDVGFMIIKELKADNIKYAGTHKKLQYYIALNKKTDKNLSAKFFDTLTNLQKKGEVKKILDKYEIK